MAANNFFTAYPAPHPAQSAGASAATGYSPAPGAVPSPAANPAAAAAAYPNPGAVAVAAGVQPAPPGAVAYNQAAASAASTYRSAPQAAVVAYTAYQPQQSAVSGASYVAPAGTGAPAAAAPVASATYPGGASTYTQYPPQPATAQVYDPNKTAAAAAAAASYYQQPSGVAVTVCYSVSDPHYQARPVYSANSNLNMVARPATAIITGPPKPSYTTYSQSSSTSSYSYGAAPTAISVAPTAAVPKHVYVQNQTTASLNLSPAPTVANGKTNTQQWNRGQKGQGQIGAAAGQRAFKARAPPKQQQLHYCEVCKISCAGPQTYKEHMEGQKHKKKEAMLKVGAPHSATRAGNALRCELCDVTCTGSDAYAAHIRGAKHQKVVKLHTKLGKPIPSVDPIVLTKKEDPTTSHEGDVSLSVVQKPYSSVTPKAPSIPKITFIGPKPDTKSTEVKQSVQISSSSSSPLPAGNPEEVTIPRLPDEKEVQPVGHDYIEEIRNDEGKVISFNCKLCECRFNDPNAKEMHMKGRRHRLQFKKKVNPDLIVDVKPSLRQKKLAEERAKRLQAREEFWKRREEEFRMVEEEERTFWEERRRMEEQGGYSGFSPSGPMPLGMMGPRFGPPPFMYGYPMMRPQTVDDKHVNEKHVQIYPEGETLDHVQKLVAVTERALKLVSDKLAEESDNHLTDKDPEKKDDKGDDKRKERALKGVMRIGVLAKGLVIKGDNYFKLVALCGMKPTARLLEQVFSLLPDQLKAASQEVTFTVEKSLTNGAVLLKNCQEDMKEEITIEISLTSPLVREESSGPNPEDMLNESKCLEALASLRHAKWFQARVQCLQPCVLIIRILRDFCSRHELWTNLDLFAVELLVEKAMASVGGPMPPGDAMRRVFETIASGILLSEAPGLLDPCEKEPRDAAGNLAPQQREDITMSAQQCLRMISFRQIHKVLGMEQLPPPKFGKYGRFSRKRRRDDSLSDGAEGEQDEKKDKKEDGNAGEDLKASGGGTDASNKTKEDK